jgi:hypothetical protein
MVAVSRPPDWTETADWLGIHYMAAIRAAKNLAVEYQARDFTAVVLACPLRNNDGFVFATEMVATKIAPRTPSTSALTPSRKDAPRRASRHRTQLDFSRNSFLFATRFPRHVNPERTAWPNIVNISS